MRPIDDDMLVQLRAAASLPIVTLAYLHLKDTDIYLANNDTDLVWDGHLWRSHQFEWSAIRLGNEEISNTVSVSIDDVDQQFFKLLATSPPNPFPVDLYLASLNANYQVQATVLIFRGILDSWKYNQLAVELEVSSLLDQWSRKTIRLYSASCRWESFKGPECGYVGDEHTCTRTYNACRAYDNADNFGGFRWLPSLEGKKLTWGYREN